MSLLHNNRRILGFISFITWLPFLFLINFLLLGCVTYAFDGYGVCASPQNLFQEKVSPKVFDMLEMAGVRWVRLGFRWDEIEPTKGIYQFGKSDAIVNLSIKHDIKILGVIAKTPEWASNANNTISPPQNYEDWERFVRKVVTHYKGQINHWEIWNEPDIQKFWKGTPEEYINLQKISYEIIKEVDPSIKVLSAGLDGNGEKYLDKLLDLNLASYCDIIAFHPYGNSPEKSVERVKNFLSIMEKHNVKKPLWFTEIGWQTGGWRTGPCIVKDEETKAAYLKKAFHLLKPYAEAIFWYRAIETPKMFGLIELDKEGNLRLTPAYDAFKEITSQSAGEKK